MAHEGVLLMQKVSVIALKNEEIIEDFENIVVLEMEALLCLCTT